VDLVAPHDPHFAARKISRLVEPDRGRVGQRRLEHPAQVHEIRRVAQLVDVERPHVDEQPVRHVYFFVPNTTVT